MSRRRPRGALEWTLRIVLAILLIALGLVVGGLIRGNFGPWKTTADTTTTTTFISPGLRGPSVTALSGADALAAAKGACDDVLGISDTVSQAADDSSAAPIAAMLRGNGLGGLRQAIGIAGPDSIIGTDSTNFFAGATKTDDSGNLTYVEDATSQLGDDCSTLGLNGSQ